MIAIMMVVDDDECKVQSLGGRGGKKKKRKKKRGEESAWTAAAAAVSNDARKDAPDRCQPLFRLFPYSLYSFFDVRPPFLTLVYNIYLVIHLFFSLSLFLIILPFRLFFFNHSTDIFLDFFRRCALLGGRSPPFSFSGLSFFGHRLIFYFLSFAFLSP